MKTAMDIENYLIQMGIQYEEVAPDIWRVKDGRTDIVISISDSVAVFRVNLFPLAKVPAANLSKLYETMLRLNALDMLHGAYGLEEDAIVIIDSLQLENLDFNEFQATIDDMSLSVVNHYPKLTQLIH